MLHDHFRAQRVFSRWRVRPCHGEPGNSYFPRLTLDSEDCLPETFAKRSGLWIGEQRSLNLLGAMTGLPITEAEKESLARWTPIQSAKNRYWRLGEEEINMMQIRPGGFFCPECVKEAAYHRVWWDFKVFRTCPVHDCAMQENPGRHDRRWPYYGLCLKKVAEPPVLSASGRDSFEGYLLQRLGAIDPISPRPLLDAASLNSILTIMPRVGMFLSNPPLWKMSKANSPGDVDVGFEALRGGEEHLVSRLVEWLRRHYGEEDLKQVGFGQFGFMRHLSKSDSGLKRSVYRAQVKACAGLGLLNPKLRSIPGVEAPLTKSNLYSAFDLTPYSAELLLERHGIELKRGSREIVEIPEATVALIRSEIDTAVTFEDAARQLGCTAQEVELVAVKLAKKGWKTCIQTRHEEGLRRRMLAAELQKMLDTLNALPIASGKVLTVGIRGRMRKNQVAETRLMADALRGAIAAFRGPDGGGLRGLRFYKPKRGGGASVGRRRVPCDAMLWSEFHAMTGISSKGFHVLKARGYLVPHPKKSSYATRESAFAFFERFITPIRCFQADGTGFIAASEAVQKLALPFSFYRKDLGITLVERNHFVELFPQYARPTGGIFELWRKFVRLGHDNCPSFIIPERPGDGVFAIFPTSRLLSVDVLLAGQKIVLSMEVRPYYRRQWRIFQELGEDFKDILASFRWEASKDLLKISATVSSVAELEKVTREFGRLNEHFRYKMP